MAMANYDDTVVVNSVIAEISLTLSGSSFPKFASAAAARHLSSTRPATSSLTPRSAK
jgi:hypothetical protein